MQCMTTSLLVLWDIDHTLVDTGGLGREAYASAFRAATGVELSEKWRFDGRTEGAAAVEALELHGLEAEPALVRRLLDEIVGVHERLADSFAVHSRALPGVREALAALAGIAGVHQSVLTGNLRAVAELKLAAVGLEVGPGGSLNMEIGAYGSDAIERTELAPVAFARAGSLLGVEFSGRNTVIVGDTPRDVATADAVGATCVAVATGYHSTEELAAAGAGVVFADLSDTGAFVAAVEAVMVKAASAC